MKRFLALLFISVLSTAAEAGNITLISMGNVIWEINTKSLEGQVNAYRSTSEIKGAETVSPEELKQITHVAFNVIGLGPIVNEKADFEVADEGSQETVVSLIETKISSELKVPFAVTQMNTVLTNVGCHKVKKVLTCNATYTTTTEASITLE